MEQPVQDKPLPKILDAGSRASFFPFYLRMRFKETKISCCNYDTKIKGIFDHLNTETDKIVELSRADLKDLPYEDESFHLVCCISVPEYTDNYERIIDELHRILHPGGTLVVTLDISLDGTRDKGVDKTSALLVAVAYCLLFTSASATEACITRLSSLFIPMYSSLDKIVILCSNFIICNAERTQMKKIILVLVNFYILLLSLVSFSIAGGQHFGVTSLKDFKVRAINIFGKRSGDVMEKMKLEPFNEIFVDRGTRVSWTNQSDTPIRIKFKKGEICKNISKNPQSPQHWLPDECYITKDPISPYNVSVQIGQKRV